MEKKLAKLERRTQEAIHTLIRQWPNFRSSISTISLTINAGQRLAPRRENRMTWWALWRRRNDKMPRSHCRTDERVIAWCPVRYSTLSLIPTVSLMMSVRLPRLCTAWLLHQHWYLSVCIGSSPFQLAPPGTHGQGQTCRTSSGSSLSYRYLYLPSSRHKMQTQGMYCISQSLPSG